MVRAVNALALEVEHKRRKHDRRNSLAYMRKEDSQVYTTRKNCGLIVDIHFYAAELCRH